MMTPQLFINYKLKSVAHLPWRMMTYKALNTFIDDIFAFVIKMPMLYRIGCFRDGKFVYDILLLKIQNFLVVFFISLYETWKVLHEFKLWILNYNVVIKNAVFPKITLFCPFNNKNSFQVSLSINFTILISSCTFESFTHSSSILVRCG